MIIHSLLMTKRAQLQLVLCQQSSILLRVMVSLYSYYLTNQTLYNHQIVRIIVQYNKCKNIFILFIIKQIFINIVQILFLQVDSSIYVNNLVLPELPYSIHLAYHQHNPSLQEILSGDETDNAANPSFSQDSTVFPLFITSLLFRVIISLILLMMNYIIILILVLILVVMIHLMVLQRIIDKKVNLERISFLVFSSYSSAGSGTFDSYLIRPSRQTSLSHRLFSPSDFTLLSNPSFSDRSSIDLTQQSYISRRYSFLLIIFI